MLKQSMILYQLVIPYLDVRQRCRTSCVCYDLLNVITLSSGQAPNRKDMVPPIPNET